MTKCETETKKAKNEVPNISISHENSYSIDGRKISAEQVELIKKQHKGTMTALKAYVNNEEKVKHRNIATLVFGASAAGCLVASSGSLVIGTPLYMAAAASLAVAMGSYAWSGRLSGKSDYFIGAGHLYETADEQQRLKAGTPKLKDSFNGKNVTLDLTISAILAVVLTAATPLTIMAGMGYAAVFFGACLANRLLFHFARVTGARRAHKEFPKLMTAPAAG